jgi:hypothetical protein
MTRIEGGLLVRSLEQLIWRVRNQSSAQIELALTRAANSAKASARQIGGATHEGNRKRALLEYARRCDRMLYYLHSGRFANDATYDDQELCRRIARLQIVRNADASTHVVNSVSEPAGASTENGRPLDQKS